MSWVWPPGIRRCVVLSGVVRHYVCCRLLLCFASVTQGKIVVRFRLAQGLLDWQYSATTATCSQVSTLRASIAILNGRIVEMKTVLGSVHCNKLTASYSLKDIYSGTGSTVPPLPPAVKSPLEGPV